MSNAQQVIGVIVLGVVALVGIAVFSPLAGIAVDMGESAGDDAIEYPDAGETYELDRAIDEEPSTLDVAPSQEYAVAFDGDGYLSDDIDEFESGDWSIAITAQLADGANEQATYALFAVDNGSVLVEYHDGDWRAINYVGDDSATATVPASDASEFTGLVASWDETAQELTLIEDGENSDTGALTADDPDRRVANDWYGTVDEVRLWNQTADVSVASEYSADPIQPLAEQDHHARYMFNEGDGETTTAYYSDSSATLTGAAWVGGVEAPELVEGTDYAISYDPLEIQILETGYLDGAPVVFVAWDSGLGGPIASIIAGVGSAMQLVPIIMIAILAAVVIGVVQRMQN